PPRIAGGQIRRPGHSCSLGAAQKPDLSQSGLLVLPKAIRIAIAIEIGDGFDAPTVAGAEDGGTGHDISLSSTEEPNLGCTGNRILPNYIGTTVAVEIPNAPYAPRIAPRDVGRADETGSLRPTEQPNLRQPGIGVLPDDIGTVVAIKIVLPLHYALYGCTSRR